MKFSDLNVNQVFVQGNNFFRKVEPSFEPINGVKIHYNALSFDKDAWQFDEEDEVLPIKR